MKPGSDWSGTVVGSRAEREVSWTTELEGRGASEQIHTEELEVVRELHSWESLYSQERIILRVKGAETELILRRVASCAPAAKRTTEDAHPPKKVKKKI